MQKVLVTAALLACFSTAKALNVSLVNSIHHSGVVSDSSAKVIDSTTTVGRYCCLVRGHLTCGTKLDCDSTRSTELEVSSVARLSHFETRETILSNASY